MLKTVESQYQADRRDIWRNDDIVQVNFTMPVRRNKYAINRKNNNKHITGFIFSSL